MKLWKLCLLSLACVGMCLIAWVARLLRRSGGAWLAWLASKINELHSTLRPSAVEEMDTGS